MMDYPEYRPSEAEVISLLSEQRIARLVTIDESGWPRIGLFVYFHRGINVEMHLLTNDPQIGDLASSGRAVIEVDEILATPRSHWVDEQDAKHGDQYYRSAILRGSVELDTDLHQVADHLRALVGRYQPEGRYANVSVEHPAYASYLRGLTVVRVRTETTTGKFKLAQRTNPIARDRIVEGLRARGSPLDQRTADLIEGTARSTST